MSGQASIVSNSIKEINSDSWLIGNNILLLNPIDSVHESTLYIPQRSVTVEEAKSSGSMVCNLVIYILLLPDFYSLTRYGVPQFGSQEYLHVRSEVKSTY